MKHKPRKAAPRADREHMGRVASLGCMLCQHLGYGETPAEVHHPRTGAGMGRRAAHTDGIALCPAHHRGDAGLHGMGRRAFEREYGITELELLELTKQKLEQTYGN